MDALLHFLVFNFFFFVIAKSQFESPFINTLQTV